MLRSFVALFSVIASASFSLAQAPQPLQTPAVNRSHIAFVYAGEIWLVERQGGEARKLFNQAGEKAAPRFSPDGSQIAFALNVGDNFEVHVAPAQGGEARRLTWHPKDDYPVQLVARRQTDSLSFVSHRGRHGATVQHRGARRF